MLVAIFLFDGVTALDAIGPYEVLSRDPATEVVFVGPKPGEVRTGNGFLGLTVDRGYRELEAPEVLILPGGDADAVRGLAGNQDFLEWIRSVDQQTIWTCSVCTGTILLAAAGLLRRTRAATNWRARDYLPRLGAIYSGERVSREGKYLTSAGVSAGLDMALLLAEQLSGRAVAEAIELSLEYDPQPPFNTGRWEAATPERIAMVEDQLRS